MYKKLLTGFYFNNLYWIGSIILSIIIISSVFISAVNTFSDRNENEFTRIPVIIQAKEQANYADGIEGLAFPGVDLAIVDEVISDSLQGISNQEEVEERIANLVEEFQQPVPTATDFPTLNEEIVDNGSPNPVETENSLIATNTLIPVTATNTRTATANISPSLTFTPSLTSTIIFSPTYTLSPTSSNTLTLTPTKTKTQTLTYTLTATGTLIPTFTSSPTITRTSTRTASITPSRTLIPTFTYSPTFTPSFTITPTWTRTLTPTFTFTPTWTRTLTPTITHSPSPTFSPTFTYTPTFTQRPTFTLTPTLTSTHTPTFTATLTPSITPSPTLVICNPEGKTLPLVKSMWPVDGSVDIPVNIQLQIIFNQAMDATTLTYGDETNIVICEKINDTSNSCRAGTEVPARIEIRSAIYQNDTVFIYPIENLDFGILYTLFAGNQITSHPDCSSVSKPLGGREQTNFITILD